MIESMLTISKSTTLPLFIETIPNGGFITPSQLISQTGLVATEINTGTTMKFFRWKRQGKEIVVPSEAFARATGANIYAAGLMYGTDSTGPSWLTWTPKVNQRKTVVINGETYIVRLMSGYNNDANLMPPTQSQVDFPAWPINSEWEDLLYPMFKPMPSEQKVPNVDNLDTPVFSGGWQVICRGSSTTSGKMILRGKFSAADRNTVLSVTLYLGDRNYNQQAERFWPVFEKV